MAQGRSTKIITTIKWIRTSRLSIKNSLSPQPFVLIIIALRCRANSAQIRQSRPVYGLVLSHYPGKCPLKRFKLFPSRSAAERVEPERAWPLAARMAPAQTRMAPAQTRMAPAQTRMAPAQTPSTAARKSTASDWNRYRQVNRYLGEGRRLQGYLAHKKHPPRGGLFLMILEVPL